MKPFIMVFWIAIFTWVVGPTTVDAHCTSVTSCTTAFYGPFVKIEDFSINDILQRGSIFSIRLIFGSSLVGLFLYITPYINLLFFKSFLDKNEVEKASSFISYDNVQSSLKHD